MHGGMPGRTVKNPIVRSEEGSFNSEINKAGDTSRYVRKQEGEFKTGMPAGIKTRAEEGSFDKQTSPQKTTMARGRR